MPKCLFFVLFFITPLINNIRILKTRFNYERFFLKFVFKIFKNISAVILLEYFQQQQGKASKI